MRIERPRPGRARGPVLGRVDRQPSPLDLAVVEDLDRRGSLGLGGELHERESPGPPGLAIRGQVDLDDAASLGQERGQSIRGDAEGEIPDEDAGCDGWCPPVLFRVWLFRSPAMVFSIPHDGLRGPPRHSGSPRPTCRRGAGDGGAFASTYWQSAWVHWTLVMQPGDYSTRGTGPARAQSSGPHTRWTGAAGAGSSSAPTVPSLAYRSPFDSSISAAPGLQDARRSRSRCLPSFAGSMY